MENVWYYDFNIGRLLVAEDGFGISAIRLVDKGEKPYSGQETPLIKEAGKELFEYFEGRRKEFNLPLSIKGTEFQKQVYKALLDIPYGQTRSYKDIAEQIGHPKAYRAVGSANNKNNIIIVVPCHRVIGSNKELTGFAVGLDVKKYLLQLENALPD